MGSVNRADVLGRGTTEGPTLRGRVSGDWKEGRGGVLVTHDLSCASLFLFFFSSYRQVNFMLFTFSIVYPLRIYILIYYYYCFSESEFHSCCQGWSAMARSWLTTPPPPRFQ